MANKLSSVSGPRSRVGPHVGEMPALLTRMSTSPTSSASHNASAGSPRSAPTNRAEPPPAFDLGDHRSAAGSVTAVHDPRGPLRGQLHCGGLTDPRRSAG